MCNFSRNLYKFKIFFRPNNFIYDQLLSAAIRATLRTIAAIHLLKMEA